MKVLLFLGAGASVELGIPAMHRMAREFLGHLASLHWPSDERKEVEKILDEENNDMEHLLDKMTSLAVGLETQRELGHKVDATLLARSQSIIREAEWFVHHLCEQLKRNHAECLWKNVLAQCSGHQVEIATTNYDRAIEIAAASAGVDLADGFERVRHQEVLRWQGFRADDKTKLLKLHGSTDWYLLDDGSPAKLRHPIPLLGELCLTGTEFGTHQLRGALILPSREKKVIERPYQELMTEFRNFASTTEMAFFIGTSLRDPHMADVFRMCSESARTVYVSRNGTSPLAGGHVVEMRQAASLFLMSTLPAVLGGETLERARESAVASGSGAGVGILERYVEATSESAEPHGRAAAIEQLSREGFQMSAADVERLLESGDRQVRMSALTMIPFRSDSERLGELARKKAQAEGDGEMLRELDLLTRWPSKGGVETEMDKAT